MAILALLTPIYMILLRSRQLGAACAAITGPLDARFVGYVLEWGYRYVHGLAGPGAEFWSPPFYFPVPLILAHSENMIGGYPVYFPLRWAGLGPASALFWFHVIQRALTPVVSYLCLRAVRFRRWPSCVAAALFSWSWVRFFHYGHIQFSAGYTIPLFVTALYFFVQRGRAWAAVAAAGTFLLTWYLSLYVAVFLVLGTVALALVWCLLPGGLRRAGVALRRHRRFARHHPGQAVAIVLLCLTAAALVAPSAVVYHRVYSQYGPAGADQIRPYWGSALSWLRPPPQHPFIGRCSSLFPGDRSGSWEKRTYLGWLGLVCLLLPVSGVLLGGRETYRAWPRPLVVASIAGLGLMAVFSSYPGLGWAEAPFWFLHRHFPGVGGLRAPSRIAFLISWFVALCAARALELVLRRRRSGPWLAVLLGLVLLAENVAPVPRIVDRCRGEETWERTASRLCPSVPRDRVGTLLFLPIGLHDVRHIAQNGMAMQLSLRCRLNVVNGYSGRRPELLTPLLSAPARRFPCAATRGVLDRIHRQTGKGVFIHLDTGEPLGPARYPATTVEECLNLCLAGRPVWYEPDLERPADVFVTDPTRTCTPPSR